MPDMPPVGSPTNPAWDYNLLAHPDSTIEISEGSEQVTAVELHGDEYDAAWRIFDAVSPDLAHYQQQPAPPSGAAGRSATSTFEP
jgi:hypothetical protein